MAPKAVFLKPRKEHHVLEAYFRAYGIVVAILCILSTIFVLYSLTFFPGLIPFNALGLWIPKGDIALWCQALWPLLAIVFLLQIAEQRKLSKEYISPSLALKPVLLMLWASIYEEIVLRWLLFAGLIPILAYIDGSCSGVIEKGYIFLIATPLEWINFHILNKYHFYTATWTVGASLVVANIIFTAGHMDGGVKKLVISWCGGLYLFWILLHYGVPIAIMAHTLYNCVIIITVGIHAVLLKVFFPPTHPL